MVTEDFKEQFGGQVLEDTIARAGTHSENAPTGGDAERLAFALLEILDFQCCKFGDYAALTDEQVRQFLIEHAAEIRKMPFKPPSFWGLFAGVYDFLRVG